MSKSRALLFAVSSVVVITLAFGAVGEMFLRYRERNRSTTPAATALFYRHERLRHALVRNSHYYQWVTINEHGFRGGPVSIEKPQGAFRVMVVGGSTVFDSYVSGDKAAWPARLQHWLGCAAPGQRVEVINAGVPGYVMLDNLIRLQTQLHQFAPDVLVLYQAHNDLIGALNRLQESSATSQTPNRVPAISGWRESLGRNSLFYAKLAARVKMLQRRSSTASDRTALGPEAYLKSIDAGTVRYARDLRSFLAIAQTFGIKVVVPEVVHIGSNDPNSLTPGMRATWLRGVGIPPELILAGYSRYEEATRTTVKEMGVPYFPLQDSTLQSPELYVEGDPVHFNDPGADRMARWITRALLDSGAVPAGTGLKSLGGAGEVVCNQGNG